MGLRDQILAAEDLRREKLDIPEWGVTVYIRTMTGRERDRLEELQSREAFADIRARIAVMCVVDEDGRLVFADGDIAALSVKSGRALDRIIAVAKRMSGFTQKDIDELGKG